MPKIKEEYKAQAKCPLCGAEFTSFNMSRQAGQYYWSGRGTKREYCQDCKARFRANRFRIDEDREHNEPLGRWATMAERIKYNRALELTAWRERRCA